MEDPQKYDHLQNQRFQVDWEAPQVSEIISDFDFSEELLEGHQKNLQRKFKQFWISKSHLF